MFSFKLATMFIDKYKDKVPPFGFIDGGGNSLGEITFLRTYSRTDSTGSKERWYEVCQRVVEGMYSIQKDYAETNRLPWSDEKAQISAQECYKRLFTLKWTPPGRGLWAMGTEMVMQRRNSAALQNCAFVSTGDMSDTDPGKVFAWIMEALMLGIGVGYDTAGRFKKLTVQANSISDTHIHRIPDSREGWINSVRVLINSYFNGLTIPKFDYSLIRAAGAPIKGFGGLASGPEPLIKLHKQIKHVMDDRIGDYVDGRLIVDIANLLGVCVVSGNVRRSATIAIGDEFDNEFGELKNPKIFPLRNGELEGEPGWAWMSNNTVNVDIGSDYESYVDSIAKNGEPGFFWRDLCREYGRLADPPKR